MNRKQRRASGQASAKKDAKSPARVGLVHQAAIKSAERMLDEGKETQAIELYKGIVARDPDNVTALFNLALLLWKHDAPEEAAVCFTRLVAKPQPDGETLASFAILRAEQHMMDEARSLMKRAENFDLSAKSMTRAGVFYRQAGDMEKAKALFSGALKKDPACIEAYYSLGSFRPFTQDDPDFLRLRALSEKADTLATDDKIRIEFTLARAFLEQKDTDEAFRRFAEGNRLKRGTYPRYDVAKAEQYAKNIIEWFSSDVVAACRGKGGGVASNRPIFIVGMPRSGSTLVDQILSSHPAVASVGESHALIRSLPRLPDTEPERHAPTAEPRITKKLVENLSPGLLDGIARQYLSLTDPMAKGHAHVVDKMLFNYLSIGIIRLALPEAKIIHCTRDPVDIGLSNWQLLFTPDIPWVYDQREIGRYYQSYKKVMAHWNAVFPGDIYEANYERMVSNQEEETRKLLSYCGLDWDDRCMNFHETKRQVQTASSAQVRRPIYGDSVKKWKKYEKYLGPLIESLGEKETP